MREITGDIWSVDRTANAICIPINTQLKSDGCLVMGAGLALDAAKRFPELPKAFGQAMRQHLTSRGQPDIVLFQHRECWPQWVVGFPTKTDWRMPSDPVLIRHMAMSLKLEAECRKWCGVLLPRMGCGLGQLQWRQVARILREVLADDVFCVVSQPAAATRST